MPSLPASAVGCAIGIADADKVGIATIAQAARPIKSRRRMGSLLVRPRFSWRWMNALKRGEFHEEKVARVHRRNPATAMRTRAGRKRSCGLDTIVLRRRRLRFGPVRVLLIGFVAADNASSNGPDFAVSCQMARDATNDSALDTSLCLGAGGGKRDAENGGTKDQRLSAHSNAGAREPRRTRMRQTSSRAALRG
jgi:hypothetical protein